MHSLLRRVLIPIAILILVGYAFYSAVYLNIYFINASDGSLYKQGVVQRISDFFYVTPIPALMIWARYNLGNHKMSYKLVRWALKTSLILVVAALTSTILYHLSEIIFTARKWNESYYFVDIIHIVHSIAEICLLTFALIQLKQNKLGKPLNDDDNKKPFEGTIGNPRKAGDKTDA